MMAKRRISATKLNTQKGKAVEQSTAFPFALCGWPECLFGRDRTSIPAKRFGDNL